MGSRFQVLSRILFVFGLAIAWAAPAEADSLTVTEATDFYFVFDEPSVLTVRAYAIEYNIDSHLWLYDQADELVTANDDYYGLDSYIETSLEAGTYRLRAGVCCGDPDRWYGESYVLDVSATPVQPTTTTTPSTTTTPPTSSSVIETTTTEVTTSTSSDLPTTTTSTDAPTDEPSTTTSQAPTTSSSSTSTTTTPPPSSSNSTTETPTTTAPATTTQAPTTTAAPQPLPAPPPVIPPPTTEPATTTTTPPTSTSTTSAPTTTEATTTTSTATTTSSSSTSTSTSTSTTSTTSSTTTSTTTTSLAPTTTKSPQTTTPVDLEPAPAEQTTTELIASVQSIEELSDDQIEALIDDIVAADLTTAEVTALVEVLNDAPDDIKEEFESAVNIYSGEFESYVPSGSTIPVSTRRTVIAVTAVLATLPSPSQTNRSRK